VKFFCRLLPYPQAAVNQRTPRISAVFRREFDRVGRRAISCAADAAFNQMSQLDRIARRAGGGTGHESGAGSARSGA